ncbi:MAG: hypothetical protein EKK64_05355 [Neisseriaceae bacterium]|nr:MAG: hypothetical protein EKK64_05355 [Neisseriaceae bacterium]
MTVTTTQLLEFLREKIKNPCSRCGDIDHLNIATIDENIPSEFAILCKSGNAVTMSNEIPCYAAACSNCGHIELFSSIIIKNQIKSKQKELENSEPKSKVEI